MIQKYTLIKNIFISFLFTSISKITKKFLSVTRKPLKETRGHENDR